MPEFRSSQRPAASLLTPADAGYPKRLLQLYDPPSSLYFCGAIPSWNRVVAIVGTRRCTAYGRRIASQLAAGLARHGVLVLSGLAWGIDAAAHTGALEAFGQTCAILASGPEECHPRCNLHLYRQMLEHGQCHLSEYPPGTPPEKFRFRERNRLIAAIAHAVVVVEAPAVSGALLTARFAADQTATEVFVVPGPADAPTFAGSHSLLREGARLVTNHRDILEDLSWHSQGDPNPPTDTSSAEKTRILDALPPEGTTIAGVAEQLGISYSVVMVALTTMELEGRVASDPAGYFTRSCRATT
ncbi:MAG: DNA-processing protein DprA [Cyanobacteria bacterium REEB65]|nr:DNA-processing protein DprA [Cyanobacteria bacterium REEB65]